MNIGGKIARSLIWWEDTIWETFWEIKGECYLISAKDQSSPSIWKESLTWIVLRIRSARGVNLEGWQTGCRHSGVGNYGRIWNLLDKTMRMRCNFQKKMEIFSTRRWTNQTPWRRSGTENIHFGAASTNSRREYYWLSWRIRRISSTTSRLISGCRWSDKWLLVHVRKLHLPPSRWTQSQALLAERRITPYSTEIHWRLQNYTYKCGC